ncbi:MAG: hypothetical protein LBE91_16220 [Tannerella sp.]|nr:hypothetical protein [Tannerella sp.]
MSYNVIAVPPFSCELKRLAIASKGKGKSGGAMVITYLKTEQGNVYSDVVRQPRERCRKDSTY